MSLSIDPRFNGPDRTGHGGYAAGSIAELLTAADPGPAAGAIEVTLRRPPPLGTAMSVRRAGTTVEVYDGDELVAQAGPGSLDDTDPVPGVDFDEAVRVSKDYRGFAYHPFPTCFVCGPGRAPGDGMRLFPGNLGEGRTATPFVAPDGVTPVLMWAVLDCPGGWTVPQESRRHVLGRVTAQVFALPAPGDRCVVTGQLDGSQGRRAFVRTTVHAPDGGVLAQAKATWVALETVAPQTPVS